MIAEDAELLGATLASVTARIDHVAFEVLDREGALEIVPMINGARLTDLVHAHEKRNGWTPDDAYGGLIPAYFNFGPMADHYRGCGGDWLDEQPRQAPLLGCGCGEWGCWPLMATIETRDEFTTWSNLRQPFRPERIYDGLGPYRFERAQFESACEVFRALGE